MNQNEDDIPMQELAAEDRQLDFELRRAALEDVEIPDIDKEFKRFRAERLQQPARSRTVYLRIAAVVAAAACLAWLFLFPHQQATEQEQPVVAGTTVYEATAPMADIALTVGNKTVDLSSREARQQGVVVNDDEMIRFLSPENVAPEDRSTLTIPQGKVAKVLLDDGTKVWLSACSRLIFPQRFPSKGTREVRLIGEGYFEVARDEHRPFIVHSGNISTTVLGTQFNIRSFEGEQPCVTLVSGSVNVSTSPSSSLTSHPSPLTSKTLTPGQQATFNAQSLTFKVQEVDTDVYTAWREGLFCFENQTLREVLTEIGRWYNLNVVFASEQHLNDPLHYNGERQWNIQQIIEQLNYICETRIHLENNNLIVD